MVHVGPALNVAKVRNVVFRGILGASGDLGTVQQKWDHQLPTTKMACKQITSYTPLKWKMLEAKDHLRKLKRNII